MNFLEIIMLAVGILLVGFIVCSILLPVISEALNWGQVEFTSLINLIVSGLAGFLSVALYEYALIFISSLVGTYFIMQVIYVSDTWEKILSVVIFLIGIGTQHDALGSGSDDE
ncbi:hypothetical protein KAR48_11235 [bacterium]|nr:hypothetical protein [bacterium]